MLTKVFLFKRIKDRESEPAGNYLRKRDLIRVIATWLTIVGGDTLFHILPYAITVMILIAITGCGTLDNYCCTSNDECLSIDGKETSCTLEECGKCVFVSRMQITPMTLSEATVAQKDYIVELTATGGIPPYTWLLTRQDENKLKWLTLTQAEDNPGKAILHNDYNNGFLYPAQKTSDDGTSLTITLKDSSRHGESVREDNQGAVFIMTIKINDCNHDTCNDTNIITPVGHSSCSYGYIKTCIRDSLNCAGWGEETRCQTSNCQSVGEYAHIGCCKTEHSCTNPKAAYCSSSNQIVKCEINETGCLAWTDPKTCADDPTSQCSDANDTNWRGCKEGQCIYRYIIRPNGEIFDAKNNLSWKRQHENGLYTWYAANNRCSSPYFVPTIDQLASIIETGHIPTINKCAFPDTPISWPNVWFWTSISSVEGWANRIDFTNGVVWPNPKTETYSVRCVRSGS